MFLTFWGNSRQGYIELFSKGSSCLCDSVIHRLGILALRKRRNNSVQWPLSRWLGDDACHRIGHLLWVGRCGRAVFRIKRRHKLSYSSLIEGSTLAICRDLTLRRDGGRIGPRLNNGGVDAKGSEFIAIRLGDSLQRKLRPSVQSHKC